jgi:hypothetical protein
MIKYFCDLCGKETGYSTNTLQVDIPGDGDKYEQVCDDCTSKVAAFVKSLKDSPKYETTTELKAVKPLPTI